MSAVLSPEVANWVLGVHFFILMFSVLVWFVLMARLHRILRTRHPQIWNRIGRPTLFLNNTVQNGLVTIRFLLAGHFRELDDPTLVRLGSFMQVFFYAYTVIFISLVALMFRFAPYASHAR